MKPSMRFRLGGWGTEIILCNLLSPEKAWLLPTQPGFCKVFSFIYRIASITLSLLLPWPNASECLPVTLRPYNAA